MTLPGSYATDVPDREELLLQLRDEFPALPNAMVVRGGPATMSRHAAHARRTHAAFLLDGGPIWGVSVFCALDDIGESSLDGLLRRFASYRLVHLPTVGSLRDAGFEFLPSFRRPHFTIRLAGGSDTEIGRLLEALGPPRPNPYHGGTTRGGR